MTRQLHHTIGARHVEGTSARSGDVFDPAAGNPFGAVLSEAMAGTVGG